MKVCIAEKPSVAKEIAEVVGAKQRKDGYYEGNGYQVTWSFGHLCELKEPHEYDSAYREWNLNMLPVLPSKFGIKLKNDKGIEKQFSIISSLFENAQEIINCGDAGQEGELIQRWIYIKTGCKKTLKRLWISSLTEEAIREGFAKLKDGKEYENLYYAGYSRAAADWLLGMNATRLYTLKFGNAKQLLSIGRVQTPTLAMIVKRQHEINDFKSAVFFELKTKYRDVIFNAQRDRFQENEKAVAEALVESLKNAPFQITSIESKEAKETAPRLFDLTSLQVECNKKFSFSADDTLKTIQNLYEKKLVTYPRVDTTYLPSDLYPKIAGILSNLTAYQKLTAALLTAPIRKSSKIFDDKKVTDHHAIIPTGVNAQGISGNEQLVYDLISKRFIAAFYPDCEVLNTTILGAVNATVFKATGKQITDAGWRAVYGKDAEEEEKEETQLLPEFVKGESGSHELFLQEGKTSPPKAFTEATLLRAMETAGKQVDNEELRELMKDNGIGRPSTRAAIIETLFRRNYIRRERKNVLPTTTGMELIRVIQNDLLKSAEMTGKWEYKLRQIEKGNYQAEAFMQEMREMVSSLVDQVKLENSKRILTASEVITQKNELPLCPKCKQANVIKGKTAYGCSNFRAGCGFVLAFVFMGKTLTDNQLLTLIKKGKTGIIKGVETNEGKKEGIIELNSAAIAEFKQTNAENKKTVREQKKIKTAICPKCRKGTMLRGTTAYGCSEWKLGCNFRLPLVYRNILLKEAYMLSLINKNETPLIKDVVFDGEKATVKLQLTDRLELLAVKVE